MPQSIQKSQIKALISKLNKLTCLIKYEIKKHQIIPEDVNSSRIQNIATLSFPHTMRKTIYLHTLSTYAVIIL